MHQSAVAQKNHTENQTIIPGVYIIYSPGVLNWTQPWYSSKFFKRTLDHLVEPQEYSLLEGGRLISGRLSVICTDAAVVEA